MEYTAVTPGELAATEGIDEWRVVLGTLRARFGAGSFPAAADLVVKITEAAERSAHHPDIDIRYPGDVLVVLSTHATGGLTTLDIELAREISRLAERSGCVASVAADQIELAIDTMDADRIRPFWAAVLGYRIAADGSLFDPNRRSHPVWFQQMDEPRADRNRFHLDISVPCDVAEQRVANAIAAGGVLVSDARAKAFWVLADADGNEACVCTWQDR